MRLASRAALAAALAAAVALPGCQPDGSGGGRERAQRPAAAQVVRAAAEKTEEAGSARVEATVSVPGAAGEMRMSGVTGWDPVAMDVTVAGGPLARGSGSAGTRMLRVDDVVYLNVGEQAAGGFGGRPWLKVDLRAASEGSGDERMLDALTGGVVDANQDPARQMALLLDSPDVKRVGGGRVGGVAAEHYSGTLTLEQARGADSAPGRPTRGEREEMLRGMRESGVEEFDIDAWIDGRGYPVRIDMSMDTSRGRLAVSRTLSDYGTGVSVEAPPASETTDLLEALEPGAGSGGRPAA